MQGKDDLLLLTKARSLGELALEQGVLAVQTPVRDLLGLGDNVVLLFLVTAVLFRAMTDGQDGRWNATEHARLQLHMLSRAMGEQENAPRVAAPLGRKPAAAPVTRWTNLIWGATSLYLLYRLGTRVAGTVRTGRSAAA